MRRLLFAICALGLSLGGCAYTTAVRGQQGKAYVVKTSPLGSSIWSCDATSGQPKCYKVKKKGRGG